MTTGSEISQRIRTALPDVESVLIVALCLSVLLILLKSMGIDVINNLGEMSQEDLRHVLIPLVPAVVSVLVKRIRDALNESTETSDRREPPGESDRSTAGKNGHNSGSTNEADERTTTPESLEFVGRNETRVSTER